MYTAALLACWAWMRRYLAQACAVIAVLTVTFAAAATIAIAMPLFTMCGAMVPQWPDALLPPMTPNDAEMPKLGARPNECVV